MSFYHLLHQVQVEEDSSKLQDMKIKSGFVLAKLSSASAFEHLAHCFLLSIN